jgi:dTDP-4-dehydrorhamnose reductase
VIVILGSGQSSLHVQDELNAKGEKYIVLGRGHWSDYEELLGLIRDADPMVVINCAAQRDIALCEEKPQTAVDANVTLPEVVSAAGFKQIYLSTDYVYDLNRENRVLSEDEPSKGALSVYGSSKLAGEKRVLDNGGIVVRISSPFGPRKSPFKPSFVDFVASSFKNLELPIDQHFRPTYMPDAAKVIVDSLIDAPSGIYHVVNEGTTDWAMLARFVREKVGNKYKVMPVTRKDTTRPEWGNLKNTKIARLRHWSDAMLEYLGR